MKRVEIRIDEALYEQCRLAAKRDRRSLNSWIEGLLLSAVSAWTMGSAAMPGQMPRVMSEADVLPGEVKP